MSRIGVGGGSLAAIADDIANRIRHQMEARAVRGANELRNAAQLVLRGQRSGRRYRVPGTKVYYQASAPGEPPAVRTGVFRMSWMPRAHFGGDTYISQIENDAKAGRYVLGEILENGTPGGQMAPRPHHDRILEKAEPDIVRIYSESYDL